MRLDALDDELFGSEVSFSHEIDIALVRNLKRAAKAVDQNRARIASSLNGKIKHSGLLLVDWFGGPA
jgi:hypothetical protein